MKQFFSNSRHFESYDIIVLTMNDLNFSMVVCDCIIDVKNTSVI